MGNLRFTRSVKHVISKTVFAAGSWLGASLLIGGCSHTVHNLTNSNNVLRYPLTVSPTTFDPALVQDGNTIDVLQNMYEGLVRWTPQNTLAPGLSDSWKVSKDGLTYTFHIRKGVTFQDGSSLTANDVAYSFKRSLSPQMRSPVAMDYMSDIAGAADYNSGKAADLAGVKVLNANTIAVRITKPKAYWIDTLAYPTAYVVSKKEADAGELTDSQAELGAGTGPFRLSQYQKDSDVQLVANAQYWDGAPKISGIDRPIIIDANTRHSLFLSGKLDMVDEQMDALAADSSNPQVKNDIRTYPRATTIYIGLNGAAFKPFADVRVRRAFAYATDKQRLRHVALKDVDDVAEDLLPTGMPGSDPSFKGIPYDPVKARELLAQAGYPNGLNFPTVPIYHGQAHPEITQIVDLLRVMWKDNLGVTVEPSMKEWGVFLHLENQNKLECYTLGWSADYLDPQDFYSLLLRTGSPENHTLYSNPEVDALCDRADVEQNPAVRSALYRKVARIAADDVPRIPLYYSRDIILVNPRVKSLNEGLQGYLPHLHDFIVN